MTDNLRVLLTESDRRAADHLAQAFQHRGHEVLRCRASDGPSFPCRGVAGPGPCPLDTGIDVAVAYRAHPYPKPTRVRTASRVRSDTRSPLWSLGTPA